jgi:hypothetical protein
VVRLHIPIVTNDGVSNLIGDRLWTWAPGELWYADFTRPHRVENKGNQLRVHLIISALVNDYILSLFPAEYLEGRDVVKTEPSVATPPSELRRFECRFTLGGPLGEKLLPALLPRAQATGGAGGGPVNAAVRLHQDQLALFIHDVPLFRLEPLSGDRLGFEGLPFARLAFGFQDARPSALKLSLKFDHQAFDVPLSPAPVKPAA